LINGVLSDLIRSVEPMPQGVMICSGFEPFHVILELLGTWLQLWVTSRGYFCTSLVLVTIGVF